MDLAEYNTEQLKRMQREAKERVAEHPQMHADSEREWLARLEAAIAERLSNKAKG
jgi:hypothetical protein